MARDPTVWHSSLSWEDQRFECPPVLCLQLGANIHYEAELLGNRVAERACVQRCPRGESESSPLFFSYTSMRLQRLSITITDPIRTIDWGCSSGEGGYPSNLYTTGRDRHTDCISPAVIASLSVEIVRKCVTCHTYDAQHRA